VRGDAGRPNCLTPVLQKGRREAITTVQKGGARQDRKGKQVVVLRNGGQKNLLKQAADPAFRLSVTAEGKEKGDHRSCQIHKIAGNGVRENRINTCGRGIRGDAVSSTVKWRNAGIANTHAGAPAIINKTATMVGDFMSKITRRTET